jgi:DNA polymerase V
MQGGKRKGAGRPAGTGKFKVPTKLMRIPTNMEHDILDFLQGGQSVRFFSSTVQAGYPELAGEGDEGENINLHSYLVEKDEDTFILTANGNSMIHAGINDGDILIVNSKSRAREGDIVIASINGEFTVKRMSYIKGKLMLQPENPDYKPIKVRDNDNVEVFGVVTHSIHKVK